MKLRDLINHLLQIKEFEGDDIEVLLGDKDNFREPTFSVARKVKNQTHSAGWFGDEPDELDIDPIIKIR